MQDLVYHTMWLTKLRTASSAGDQLALYMNNCKSRTIIIRIVIQEQLTIFYDGVADPLSDFTLEKEWKWQP